MALRQDRLFLFLKELGGHLSETEGLDIPVRLCWKALLFLIWLRREELLGRLRGNTLAPVSQPETPGKR